MPSYRIDLSDDKVARFSAQAQIVNEMADLDAVQAELVTGFPNIQFPELPNPVAMSQTLAEFLRALAAGNLLISRTEPRCPRCLPSACSAASICTPGGKIP